MAGGGAISLFSPEVNRAHKRVLTHPLVLSATFFPDKTKQNLNNKNGFNG